MSDICPKIAKCPLFNDNLLIRPESSTVYKNSYCLDHIRHKDCMRYKVSEKLGSCPKFVMPNSMLTIEEIVERMNKQKLPQK